MILSGCRVSGRFPNYVDHAAGKGILHLTDELRGSVIGEASLLFGPIALAIQHHRAAQVLLRVNVARQKGTSLRICI